MTSPLDEPPGHVPVASFEEQYRAEDDPWRFASSAYEQRRYALTVAMLPTRRYRSAFEPGCSIGELTQRLAHRCDHLLEMDASSTAVARARERCRGLDHVEVVVGELPQDWPAGSFDLIVLSELGYYFNTEGWARLVGRSVDAVANHGTLLAVHWRGRSADHILHGDLVHVVARRVASAGGLRLAGSYIEAAFRADVWTKGAA